MNSSSLYVIRSTYKNGNHSSKIVEKLGTYVELSEKSNGEDPINWAKGYIAKLNELEKSKKHDVLLKYSPVKRINKDEQHAFNGGYLFLQKIYFVLGLHTICKQIAEKYKFTFIQSYRWDFSWTVTVFHWLSIFQRETRVNKLL